MSLYKDSEKTFSMENSRGRIGLNGRRFVMMNAGAVGFIRRLLLKSLGPEVTRSILWRFGLRWGKEECERIINSGHDITEDGLLKILTELHSFTGMAAVEIDSPVMPGGEEPFRMTGCWRDSYEAEQHIEKMGKSDGPVCWTLAGYISGFTGMLFGRDAICVEKECAGKGDERCVFEVRFAGDWNDPDMPERKWIRSSGMDADIRDLRDEMEKHVSGSMKSEERYGELIDDVSDIIFRMDMEGRFTYYSRQMTEYLGYGERELIGRKYHSMIHPDDLPPLRKAFWELAERGTPFFDAEYRIKTKDGRWRYHQTKIRPRYDERGDPRYVVGVARDITRRRGLQRDLEKYAEELEKEVAFRIKEATEKERKYRTLFETSRDAIYFADARGGLTDINPAMEKLFGYSRDELIHIDVAETLYVNPGDRERFMARLLNKSFVEDYEFEIKTSDGRKRIIQESASALYDEQDKLEGYEGILRDITEMTRARESIRYLKEFNESIIETINIGIMVLSGDLVTVTFNRALESMMGMDREKIEGRRPWDILGFMKERKINILAEEALSGKAVLKENIPFQTPGGKEGYVSLTLFPLKNIRKNIVGVVGLFEDITRKKELEKQLREVYYDSIKALVYALEEKDTYTRGHSIRVSDYSMKIAKKLGLDDDECEVLRQATLLHDIGKIGISGNILNKPGKLTREEMDIMRTHPARGQRILSSIPGLERVAGIVFCHHERIDGKGYEGIPAGDIPFLSKIIAVADTYDAITSTRLYRKAAGKAEAMEELERVKGTQLDSGIVDVFLEILNEEDKERGSGT